jgi:hypothetical protein
VEEKTTRWVKVASNNIIPENTLALIQTRVDGMGLAIYDKAKYYPYDRRWIWIDTNKIAHLVTHYLPIPDLY